MSNFSVLITTDGEPNTGDATKYFNQPIELKGYLYQMGLNKLDLTYSWQNISSSLGNNVFKYNNGVTNKTLTLDSGVYSYIDLVQEIHDLMLLEGDYTLVSGSPAFDIDFTLELSSGYSTIILTNSYTVDFTGLGIRNIFGFNSAVYNASAESPNKSDINAGVESILVHCDLVRGSSWVNNVPSDVIYSFKVIAQPNETISLEPNMTKVLPINQREIIQSIRCYLTDQNLRVINLQNEGMTLDLVFVPIVQY